MNNKNNRARAIAITRDQKQSDFKKLAYTLFSLSLFGAVAFLSL